jgi:hypothetical protein
MVTGARVVFNTLTAGREGSEVRRLAQGPEPSLAMARDDDPWRRLAEAVILREAARGCRAQPKCGKHPEGCGCSMDQASFFDVKLD